MDLVAVATTPAWTPLFAMASVVVTDLGGSLSHSSIVARDYGIPAAGNIAGRLYFNLSLITSLYHTVGMDARKEKFGDLLGATPPELNIPYLPFSPLTVIWNVVPGMIKDRLAIRCDTQKFAEYVVFLPEWVRATRPRIQQCTNAAGLLKSGDRVRVDGGRGTVEILTR